MQNYFDEMKLLSNLDLKSHGDEKFEIMINRNSYAAKMNWKSFTDIYIT